MAKTVGQTLYHWRSSVLVGFALTLNGCVSSPPPFEEYTVARAAVMAAKEIDSAKFATSAWNKSEEYYRRGENAFQNRDFEVAKVNFRQARIFAEKAENLTRLRKFQSGDNFQ